MTFFLLWCDGESERDYYLLSNKNPPQLFFTRTERRLEDYANSQDLYLASERLVTYDFNATLRLLDKLNPDKPQSKNSCILLLETWNALDDVSNSIKKSMIPMGYFRKNDIEILYKKIFFGNNLPSLTPEGKSYSPVLTAKECKIAKKIFRTAILRLATLVKAWASSVGRESEASSAE
jgi:hypothetical protein